MSPKIRQTLFPILAALIWGTAFVAQSVCTDDVQPFTFNALRSAIATVELALGLWLYRSLLRRRRPQAVKPLANSRRDLLLGGLCCGSALFVAANLQQAGLAETAPGKAGFITALYIVLVPVLGLFLRRRVPYTVWIGVVLAAVGLYFLCMAGERFSLQRSDTLVILGSLAFAVHILVVDHFTQRVDGVALSCAQLAVLGLFSAVAMLLFEQPDGAGILRCIWPILYVGIFSSGAAYTLQILAQKGSDPTVVSLLLSLESVFSVLAGALLLHSRLSGRELLGCGLVFAAVILAQLPARRAKQTAERK